MRKTVFDPAAVNQSYVSQPYARLSPTFPFTLPKFDPNRAASVGGDALWRAAKIRRAIACRRIEQAAKSRKGTYLPDTRRGNGRGMPLVSTEFFALPW